MFLKRFSQGLILLTLLTLLVGSSVLADDGRINRAPYHFGGDTLFCNQEKGCTLLNMTGHDLAHWSQDAVATALAKADQSEQRSKVDGDGQGTYGPMQLWAMPNKTEDGNSTLCVVGFDEWAKQNDMCFQVTQDWHFEQAALPVVVAVAGVAVVPVTDCSMWSNGDYIKVIGADIWGSINEIDAANGTVTFGKAPFGPYTYGCDKIELAK